MIQGDVKKGKILVIDDEQANVDLLTLLLGNWGFQHIKSLTDSTQALDTVRSWRPDIVLLDLHMPGKTGFQVLEELRPMTVSLEEYLPIIVLTADATQQARQRALSGGAKDFLSKPFDAVEVCLRTANLLETRLLQMRLSSYNQILEKTVSERTAALVDAMEELQESKTEILRRLARAAEFRDDATGEHTLRVGIICAAVARRLRLPEEYIENIERVAPLHDIGKIGVPDEILLKPGKLDPAEWETMKQHTTIGSEILSGSKNALIEMAEEIVRTHHECWDGSGYIGMKGEDIPMSGRIVTVADVFDALVHDRPYKKAWPVERALEELRAQRGEKFDPKVVDAFTEAYERGEIPV